MKTKLVLIAAVFWTLPSLAQDEFFNAPTEGLGFKKFITTADIANAKITFPYAATATPVADPNIEITQPVAPCVTPKVNSNVKNTPFDIVIDQEKQLMYVTYPENGKMKYFATRISSGGGLKKPNGKFKRPPYCAKTPEIKTKIIPAIQESDFDTTTCNARQIRARATLFKEYKSETFLDAEGNPIPMPFAIRLDDDGDFIHQRPSAYHSLLGENVSGGCVRTNPTVAKILYQQMIKHGGVRVTVKPPPAPERCKPQYCDEKMEAEAVKAWKAGHDYTPTGSEGIVGGVSNFWSKFTCTDTKNSTPLPNSAKVFPHREAGRQ